MSYWTYITGVIEVSTLGRTQPEMRYILDTVLEHQPDVTGSESNMKVHVLQSFGHNMSSSHNEFLEPACFRVGGERDGIIHMQSQYFLVLEAKLRDRMFSETLREFNKWINRLAKRVFVDDILVRVSGQDREFIFNNAEPYSHMFEGPSWCSDDGEPAWSEYLMWSQMKNSYYPMMLGYKYINDPENDAEVERRLAYGKE